MIGSKAKTHAHRGAVVLFALLLAACGRACGNDKPYVPYTIDDDAGAIDAGFHRVEKVDASEADSNSLPPHTTHAEVEGMTVDAPAGDELLRVLVRDFDGDGKKDALALIRKDTDASDADDEIAYFYGGSSAGAPPSIVTRIPTRHGDASCSPADRLVGVGKQSAFVEIGVACAGHGEAPPRWIGVVLAKGPSARIHFSAEVLDPSGAPRLEIEADGADRDHDGIDDVAVRFSIAGTPGVTASLVYLDRPAGPSRDASEPENSFHDAGITANQLAKHQKDAVRVAANVDAVRSLERALCDEGGSPRVTKVNGAGAVSCGQSVGLEDVGLAAAHAYAVLNQPLQAISALDRAAAKPATHTASKWKDAEGYLAIAAPSVTVTEWREAQVIPDVETSHAPAWGPFELELGGKLLVRAADQVVRVDLSTWTELPAPDKKPWPKEVFSPDGSKRWIETYDGCDGAVHATFAPTKEGDPIDVVLPIAPPLGPRCTSHGQPVLTVPIAWTPHGLGALVGGEVVHFPADLSTAERAPDPVDLLGQPGSPKSHAGRALVYATSRGLLVRAPKWRLAKIPAIESSYGDLRGCAVDDDGLYVACVKAGRAWIATLPPAAP